MRQVLFVTRSVVGLVAIAMSSSPGLARTRVQTAAGPPGNLYCVQGHVWGYPGNCQFSTYNQCAVTASGTIAYCGVNPRYLFAGQQRGYWPPR